MQPLPLANDGRADRPTPQGGEVVLPLSGGPLDARLPLALLEAVKAIDTPTEDVDADFVHELRNKRLGLTDTVLQQIRRYQDAARSRQRLGYDEVLALARLIGRRPDADEVFREAGRRWAQALVDTVSSTRRSALRSLPELLSRPLALGVLRDVVQRGMDGTLERQGSAVLLDVRSPVSADAAPKGGGCVLYETAFREVLRLVADADGAVDHVTCRTRGDASCQWRTDWRRH